MFPLLFLCFFVGVASAQDVSSYHRAHAQTKQLAQNPQTVLNDLEKHIFYSKYEMSLHERQELIAQLELAKKQLCVRPSAGVFSYIPWMITIAAGYYACVQYQALYAQHGSFIYKQATQQEIDVVFNSLKNVGWSLLAALYCQACYSENVDTLFAQQKKYERQIDAMISDLNF